LHVPSLQQLFPFFFLLEVWQHFLAQVSFFITVGEAKDAKG
jgi:hypothetical protein